MADFQITEGMRLPPLKAVLEDQNGPIDLSPVSAVKFYMSRNGVPVVAGVAMVIVDAPTGVVQYNWAAGNTTLTGLHEAQIEITLGGLTQRFPSPGYLYVDIVQAA